jgi:excisionase family DNA binding protein
VARLLGVHPKHVYRLLRAGLPALRVGSEWRFEGDDVLAWARARGTPTAPPRPREAPLLIAANDDEVVAVLLDELQARGGPLLGLVRADSGTALDLLERRRVLAAGFHRREVPAQAGERRLARIHLVDREVGLVGRSGRAAPRLPEASGRRLASRPATAGVRSVLDAALREAGVDAERTHARALTLPSHRDVVLAVGRGAADVGVTSHDWGARSGLPFRSLGSESYDLLVAADDLGHPAVVALLACAQSTAFRRRLRGLAGHTAAGSGDVRVHPAE